MGLDTTHNAWHGPYSMFNTFRFALAKQIGINLNEYSGYKPSGQKSLDSIEHDIMPLLNHSDCDGELSVSECERIVKGLNDIQSKLKNPDNDFLRQLIQFKNGCIEAISKNEPILFQ
jgi:hypothetical protein